MRSFGRNPNGILRSDRSSAARHAQMAETEMATRVFNICVPDLRNNEPAIGMQKTTKLPVTNRYADELPSSEEDHDFPHENN